MAKIIFGMNVSLDGYVDHERFAPDETLFRHWIEHVQGTSGSIYGSGMYDIMRYWDTDDTAWNDDHYEFAYAWRQMPKWVISHSLSSVGPNATLIQEDLEGFVHKLKAEQAGEISVSGPKLAKSFMDLGLIDEYRLYMHPVILGSGVPLFAGPGPRLRLKDEDRIGDDVIRLTYIPA
jgi:dihydrofolate reductase